MEWRWNKYPLHSILIAYVIFVILSYNLYKLNFIADG